MRACIVPSSVLFDHDNWSPTYYLGRRRPPDRVKLIAWYEAQIEKHRAQIQRLLLG